MGRGQARAEGRRFVALSFLLACGGIACGGIAERSPRGDDDARSQGAGAVSPGGGETGVGAGTSTGGAQGTWTDPDPQPPECQPAFENLKPPPTSCEPLSHALVVTDNMLDAAAQICGCTDTHGYSSNMVCLAVPPDGTDCESAFPTECVKGLYGCGRIEGLSELICGPVLDPSGTACCYVLAAKC
jgi:hypothetical protein